MLCVSVYAHLQHNLQTNQQPNMSQQAIPVIPNYRNYIILCLYINSGELKKHTKDPKSHSIEKQGSILPDLPLLHVDGLRFRSDPVSDSTHRTALVQKCRMCTDTPWEPDPPMEPSSTGRRTQARGSVAIGKQDVVREVAACLQTRRPFPAVTVPFPR